jgi:hypothetical protein
VGVLVGVLVGVFVGPVVGVLVGVLVGAGAAGVGAFFGRGVFGEGAAAPPVPCALFASPSSFFTVPRWLSIRKRFVSTGTAAPGLPARRRARPRSYSA